MHLASKIHPDPRADLLQELLRGTSDPLFTKRQGFPKAQVKPLEGQSESPTKCLRPFYQTLRLLGCLPFSVAPDGQTYVKILSPIMAYTLAFYTLAMVAIYSELKRRFIITGQLDTVVNSCMYLFLFLKNMIVPAILWLPIQRMQNHQTRWISFQATYARTTGHKLKFELERVTPYINVVIPVFAACLSSLWVYRYALHEPWLLLVYMLPQVTSLALDGIWCCSYIILGLAAEKITASLKVTLDRYRGSPGLQEHVMREYRALWLELSRLLQSNNDVSTVTFTYHTAHVFLMLTLSLYAVLSGLRAQWDFEQTLRAIATVLYLVELWAIANAAHFTTSKFDEIQWESFLLIPAADTPAGVRKEISTLLEVAAASPRLVDIGGFVTINRSWLTNMLGNLLSSLIILLQFKVSQNEDGSLQTTTVVDLM